MTGTPFLRHALILSLILLPPATGAARTWIVSPDGGGDAPTIAAAIDSMSSYDRIELLDGVYSGPGNRDLDNMEKAVKIISQSGDPETCIIDCGGTADEQHYGIRFYGGG